MLARLRFLILGLWLGCLASADLHAATSVVIVSSESNAAYTETAQALVEELERSGISRSEVLLLRASEWPLARAPAARLYVTLGAEAAGRLARSELAAPLLCALLPRSSFERVLQQSGRKASPLVSAIVLDQPMSRQLELIRIALPTVRRIGVLWGAQMAAEAPALKAQALSHGLQLTEAAVAEEEPVFPALRQVLEASDLLLAIPNPQVYNSASIQNILLTSFRARVPMLAFSAAYARAGALLSLQATPSQIGLQAGAMARAVLHGKALPEAPVYSNDFEITVNDHVARSLGLKLDAQSLHKRLRQREGEP